jgi:hypothetical protein
LKPCRLTASSIETFVTETLPTFKPWTIPKPGQSGNSGGKPFTKITQRLSQVVADQLAEVAPVQISAPLGLRETATWGECATGAIVLRATACDVGAAHFLHAAVESAKVLPGEAMGLAFNLVFEACASAGMAKAELTAPDRHRDGESHR